MQLLYGGKAREAGLYIIGACGFDSVPSDMGVAFTRDNFAGKFSWERDGIKLFFYFICRSLSVCGGALFEQKVWEKVKSIWTFF